MARSRLLVSTVALGLLAALGAACGSDDDDGEAGNATSTSAATSATSQDPDTEASGEPIRLGLITRPQYMEFLPAGAEAAIARINEEGGIGGRPLELVPCSNEDNANAAAACAQDFASDESIIATVGDNNSFGGDSNPPLEAAMLAGVGTSPLGAGDFASPRIFPSNSGGLQFLAAAGFLFDEGFENIGMATIDTPTAQSLPGLVNSTVLGPRGGELGGTVAIPATAADVSTQAASMADSDGQMLALTEDLALRYIRAGRQQGFTGPFVISETVVEAGALAESLSDADLGELFALSYFDKNSEGYGGFLEDMAEYEPDTTPGDLNAIAWLSVMMFADVARELPEVTRQSVWDAMNQLADYDTNGMTPAPLDFTTPGTALGGNAPRLVPSVLQVYVDVYEDGEYVPRSDEQEPIAIFAQG